jgi:serine/threonine-protein kinase SRK2
LASLLNAGLYSIWIQQIRTSWQESPHNNSAVSKLSKDCRDLLDKMFDVNQDSRITIDGIIRCDSIICYDRNL